MGRPAGIPTLVLAAITVTSAPANAQSAPTRPPACEPSGSLSRVAELPEGSGLAASRRTPGRFWAHNDSGKPVLVALDSRGTVVGRLQIDGARVEDWEAIAVGPCPGGSCLYIGDIGDNDAKRRNITIYRVPEPVPGPAATAPARADAFRFTYPDGAHDAETLLVVPGGDLVVVTKARTGSVGLYRGRVPDSPGATAALQTIGTLRRTGKVSPRDRISDGTVSPDGDWIALRTNSMVMLYRTDDLLSGTWKEAGRVTLEALGEPQGEGIAFGDNQTLYLVGEGGGKSKAGTFGRMTCTL